MASEQEPVTTREAAATLGVHPATIRRWATDGLLSHTLTPSGRLRFTQADLDAALTRVEKATPTAATA